jgi:hypothetical protein
VNLKAYHDAEPAKRAAKRLPTRRTAKCLPRNPMEKNSPTDTPPVKPREINLTQHNTIIVKLISIKKYQIKLNCLFGLRLIARSAFASRIWKLLSMRLSAA